MTREIKFRGKRVGSGEWVYGALIPVDCNPAIAQDQFEWVEQSGLQGGDWWHVIPESVGQFSGSKDKNGKEIYEGDICECHDMGGDSYLSKITFDDGAFAVEVHDCDYSYTAIGWALYADIESIEVIGNIHDNVK